MAGLPRAIGGTLELVRTGSFTIILVLFILIGIILITGFVVFIERAQRKVPVNYAKRQVGNKLFAGQSSHLPLKLNMSVVIPPIFASYIILFPSTLFGWFSSKESLTWLKDISGLLQQDKFLYFFTHPQYFFCYFYTA